MSWFSAQDLLLALMTVLPACAALLVGVELLIHLRGNPVQLPAERPSIPPAPVVLEHLDEELGELVGVR